MSSQLLYKAAKDTLVEYLHKTSLNGCYLLYCIRKRKHQRLFWFMFIVMTVAFATYVCTTVLMSFFEEPIVTSLDSQEYFVYDAPFPTVAVCSYNQFNRAAIRKYALNITLHGSKNETVEYWEDRLKVLSGIYNYDSIQLFEVNKLHLDLENIFGEPFKISEVIEMLAPLCEDLIVKCLWAGELINCREQFELKMFIDGPCCVFNYQYMKNPELLFYPIATGHQMGLILLLNTSNKDYFYAADSAVGFQIKLFSNQRMPDINMGDIEEFHVGVADEVDVRLILLSQVTLSDARHYGVQKRRCYFPFENKKTEFYESDCFLICQILFIANNCNCLPFYALNSDIESDDVLPECSLKNLGCFDFYKHELTELECSECFPLCSYNRYNFRKTANGLKHSFRHFRHSKMIFDNVSELPPDLSLVKIFYPSEHGIRYFKRALYDWYHMLSTIGGVIGICMGCSIVNVIEIIYFVCFRLVEKFLKLKIRQ